MKSLEIYFPYKQAKRGERVKELFLLLLLFLVMVEDLRLRKISNDLVLTGLFTGVLYLVADSGWSGLFLGGTRLAVMLLGAFLIYQCSAFGAGDLKLISIMSLFFDWGVYIEWLSFSLLFSGVVALFYAAKREKRVPLGVAFFGGMMMIAIRY